MTKTLGALAACTWAAAVFWLWRAYVPLVPIHVTPLNNRTVSFDPRTPGRPLLWTPDGLVQQLDPLTGRIEQEFLTPSLRVHTLIPQGFAVVHDNGELAVIRLVDRAEICRLPEAKSDYTFLIAGGGDILIARPGSVAIAYDLKTGSLLWTRENVNSVDVGDGAGHRLVRVDWTERDAAATDARRRRVRRCFLVDARTGEADTRFEDVSQLGWIRYSSDGRRLVVVNDGWFRIFEAESGRRLWMANSMINANPRFSRDDREVHVAYRDGNNAIHVARWNADNGEVLSGLPETAGAVTDPISPDGRFAIRLIENTGPPDRVVQILSRMPIPLVQQTMAKAHLAIVDNERNTVVGRITDTDGLDGLPIAGFEDAQRFWLMGRNTIASYTLPPARNWKWLIIPSVLPPGALLLICLVRKARHGRRPHNSYSAVG